MNKLIKLKFSAPLKSSILISIALIFCGTSLSSQDIIWDFGTIAPGTATPSSNTAANMTGTPTVVQGNNNGTTAMLTTISVSNNSGASGSYNAGAAARVGALNTAASGSAYFEFTLTPATNYSFTLTSLAFNARSTTTGPQAYALRSSLDAYGSDIVTGTFSNNSTWAAFSNSPGSSSSSGVTFRIYAYDGTGAAALNTANWRIDDLNLGISTMSILPVELATFYTTLESKSITLSFTTATERNNAHFDIERSNDGRTFSKIGEVTGAGDSQVEQNYTFEDKKPAKGINYYRLRQVDFDGASTVSAIRSVVFGKTSSVVLYPTPTTDMMNVRLEESFGTEAQWQVIDLMGRIVSEGIFPAEQTEQRIPVSTLTDGNYILRVTAGQEVLVHTFRKTAQ